LQFDGSRRNIDRPSNDNNKGARVMSDLINGKPPTSFWVIAIVALMWNIIGVMLYYMQVSASDECTCNRCHSWRPRLRPVART
jgi:hypothetical protein